MRPTKTRQPGRLAARKTYFGPLSRFAVAPVHARSGPPVWFVWDAEQVDPVTGGPAVVRQAASRALAVAGLD